MLPFVLDELIGYLLAPKLQKRINIPEMHLNQLLNQVYSVLLREPALLYVDPPLNVLGDIHGQYTDLLRYFEYAGHPPEERYLFLGDYVDRGRNSIETITLLFAYKVKYPNHLHLLRGNHESASINQYYGFFDECKRRATIRLWKQFVDCYNCLPIAAIIGNRIFCCHGGLSPSMHEFQDIVNIQRPLSVPDSGLLCDLLWSDPSPQSGWTLNDRGISYCFGPNVVYKFMKRHKLDLICRAHQVVEDGYEFFAKRQVVTVFSAPNYCGEFDNAGAMMIVSPQMVISFYILKPENDFPQKPVKSLSSDSS